MPGRMPAFGPGGAPNSMASGLGLPADLQQLQNALPPLPPGMTQEQLAALQSQLTPEMIQQASLLLQDPKVREQMEKLQALAASGQLTPEMMSQLMPGMMGGMLPDGMNPKQLAITGILAVLMGWGVGKAVDNFVHGPNYHAKSLFERFLRGMQSLPGASWLNRQLQLPSSTKGPALENLGQRLQGAISGDAMVKNYLETHIGPRGHFYGDLAKMRLPKELLTRLSNNTHNLAQLKQIIEPSAVHFLPQSLRDIASQELHGGFFNRNLVQPLGRLFKAILPTSWYEGAKRILPWAQPVKTSTLEQLQRLIDKENLLSVMQKAVTKKQVTPQVVELIKAALEQPIKGRSRHAGDLFAANLTKILQNKDYAPVAKAIRKALGLTQKVSYDTIRAALVKESKSPLVWEAIHKASQGLVSQVGLAGQASKAGFKLSGATTLSALEGHIQKSHILRSSARKGLASRLQGYLGGLVKRVNYLEKYHKPVVEAEHAIYDMLKKRGVGPVGRFFGKVGYFFQRIFEGASFKRFQNNAAAAGSPWFGRTIVSLFTFGTAISGYRKGKTQESKIARFFEGLSESLGGYMGFEVGRNYLPGLGLLTRNKWIAKFANAKFLGFLPWTYGGFLTEVVFTSLCGFAVGYVCKKISNAIFGDPDVLEKPPEPQKPAATNPAAASLTGDRRETVNSAGTQNPSATSTGKGGYVTTPGALTPENMGLTPEQIAFNPLEVRNYLHGESMAQKALHEQHMWLDPYEHAMQKH